MVWRECRRGFFVVLAAGVRLTSKRRVGSERIAVEMSRRSASQCRACFVRLRTENSHGLLSPRLCLRWSRDVELIRWKHRAYSEWAQDCCFDSASASGSRPYRSCPRVDRAPCGVPHQPLTPGSWPGLWKSWPTEVRVVKRVLRVMVRL